MSKNMKKTDSILRDMVSCSCCRRASYHLCWSAGSLSGRLKLVSQGAPGCPSYQDARADSECCAPVPAPRR
jgi:hypothetical protein